MSYYNPRLIGGALEGGALPRVLLAIVVFFLLVLCCVAVILFNRPFG